MTQIYVNDANILIDLCNLEIVPEFLALGFDLCTTDFVLAELDEEQAMLFRGKLTEISTSESEMLDVIILKESHSALSFEDCTAWFHASSRQGVLVTSDKALRNAAANSGTIVKGILHLFDQMRIQNCMTLEKCIVKLQELIIINPRAPKKLIQNLIEEWQKQ